MSSEARAADIIEKSSTLVAFTGAGISTESGVPDFRSPGGIWDRYDPDLFTIQRFRFDPKDTWKKMLEIGREMLNEGIKPNPGHLALAELEELGILKAVITQNVDNLHQEAGNTPEQVIELHGNLRGLECTGCGKKSGSAEDALEKGEEEIPPICGECGSVMKPAAVFFGEQLPRRALLRAESLASESDAFLVVGSSLTVHPAASFPPKAARTGADLIIVNRDPTPIDDMADVVIHGDAGKALPEIVRKIRS